MNRYWINQPSSLQPLHYLHGVNVLASPASDDSLTTKVYFTSGAVISMEVFKNCLSSGWK